MVHVGIQVATFQVVVQKTSIHPAQCQTALVLFIDVFRSGSSQIGHILKLMLFHTDLRDVNIPNEHLPLEESHLENNEQLCVRPSAVVGVALHAYIYIHI